MLVGACVLGLNEESPAGAEPNQALLSSRVERGDTSVQNISRKVFRAMIY